MNGVGQGAQQMDVASVRKGMKTGLYAEVPVEIDYNEKANTAPDCRQFVFVESLLLSQTIAIPGRGLAALNSS